MARRLTTDSVITIGKMNLLRVIETVPAGIYLDGREHGELFLSTIEEKPNVREGDTLNVFLHVDLDGNIAVTTSKPLAQLDEFAALRVVGVHPDIGAFLEWGLPKDLLLPSREMDVPVTEGETIVIYVFADPVTGRIQATSRLTDRVSPAPANYDVGQPVDLLIVRRTPLGYIALVENRHLGLLYHSTSHEPLPNSERVQGYIGAIRPDGKIDLTLDSSGSHRVATLTEQILSALERNGGSLSLDDSSPPGEIRAAFGASKKAFKQALGSLYKQRLIRFTHPGVEAIKDLTRPKPRR